MNWTNIMSSKGQVYAKKAVDFISKTEGPVYFEQVGTEYPMFLNIYYFIYKLLLLNFMTLKPTSFSHVHNGQTCFLAFFQLYEVKYQ